MRDYVSLEIRLHYPNIDHILTLSENRVSYQGDSSFEVEGEFPFWKAGNYVACYQEDICLFKGESKIGFELISYFDNGDVVPLVCKGTLYQNDLVFFLDFFREELKAKGQDIPHVFLEEYYEGERNRYPSYNTPFLVQEKKIDGRLYHIEGDILDKQKTRIFDISDENEGDIPVEGALFDRIYESIYSKTIANMGKKVRGCRFEVKIKGKKRLVTKDNIDCLYPLMQQQYDLPDIIFGYQEVGIGYHASLRADGQKGVWYYTCLKTVNLEETYKAMYTNIASVILERARRGRMVMLEELSFHFLPYEYVGAREPLKQVFEIYEKELDTTDCLSYVESIGVVEERLEKAGYDWELLRRARDYLLRLERIGFMEALSMKKPA